MIRIAVPLVALVPVLGGCVATLPFTPNSTLVDTLGPIEASRQLSELLPRALYPLIGKVDVGPDYFDYQLRNAPGGDRVYFTQVDGYDVFENAYVYLYTRGHVFLAKFLFASLPDAYLFTDLVFSFRDYRLRQTSSPLPGPDPGAPSRGGAGP